MAPPTTNQTILVSESDNEKGIISDTAEATHHESNIHAAAESGFVATDRYYSLTKPNSAQPTIGNTY